MFKAEGESFIKNTRLTLKFVPRASNEVFKDKMSSQPQ